MLGIPNADGATNLGAVRQLYEQSQEAAKTGLIFVPFDLHFQCYRRSTA
jgi:hypothetical protein